MFELKRWFFGLIELLSNQSGENADGDDDDSGDDDDKNAEGLDEGGDAGDDSGKDVGKDRSQSIPRERFDKVNAQAKKLAKLIELGIVSEDEDGEIRLNPEILKPKDQDKADKGKDDFRFTRDEVDDKSWPLVKKINDGFDHFDGKIRGLVGLLLEVQSAFQAVDQYPEYLQKDSPLKKMAQEIMKDDPEFRATYARNPKKFLWAVKRAAEKLKNSAPEKKSEKPKSSFIIGKGDTGKTSVKKIDLAKLTTEELDKLERDEFDRSQKRQSKK